MSTPIQEFNKRFRALNRSVSWPRFWFIALLPLVFAFFPFFLAWLNFSIGHPAWGSIHAGLGVVLVVVGSRSVRKWWRLWRMIRQLQQICEMLESLEKTRTAGSAMHTFEQMEAAVADFNGLAVAAGFDEQMRIELHERE